MDSLDAIRYPMGRVTIVTDVTPADRSKWIAQIEAAPANLRSALEGLSDQQLDREKQPEGLQDSSRGSSARSARYPREE